jgi:hypothetical protein
MIFDFSSGALPPEERIQKIFGHIYLLRDENHLIRTA